ncbi:MAG TPA: cyclic nucleotide-binding domain-containing protein, partial [Kofleriaceae bacterium]|nr:cyclic nucleotide-binding domain-containing protein [Kofleriaceae bacterium]
FGRRLARDRALALLRELPVTAVVLDLLIAAELAALDRVVLHASALVELGDPWVQRRMDERVGELGHTTLLLVAARERSTVIAHAARLLRAARGPVERARALEALDAGLPRNLALVLLPALEDVAPAVRARGALVRADRPPDLDAAITAELAGDDPLTRGALLRALGDRRAHYRRAIADAAQVAATLIDPFALLRRITDDDEEDDVPAPVELMLLLAQVPLLRELTTAQIAALVERAEVVDLADGDVLYADGERVEALVVVAEGALASGDHRFAAGHALDELAPLAPRPTALRVVAVGPTRIARIPRLELDELVDDEPGLAAVLLRHLGERLRATAP